MTGQEYVPSTEQVRSHYVFNQSKRWHAERGASFDRWLREDRLAQMRFWSKVDFTDSCWLWIGGIATNGYGRVKHEGRMKPAHRVAYEWLRGAVPAGLELDHVKEWGCSSRACVNPAHLEPVTHRENTMSDAAECRKQYRLNEGWGN